MEFFQKIVFAIWILTFLWWLKCAFKVIKSNQEIVKSCEDYLND